MGQSPITSRMIHQTNTTAISAITPPMRTADNVIWFPFFLSFVFESSSSTFCICPIVPKLKAPTCANPEQKLEIRLQKPGGRHRSRKEHKQAPPWINASPHEGKDQCRSDDKRDPAEVSSTRNLFSPYIAYTWNIFRASHRRHETWNPRIICLL